MAKRSFWAASVISLIGLGLLTGCNVIRSTASSEDTYEILERVSRIEVESTAGEVTVATSEGPVKVTEELRYAKDRPKTTHSVSDGALDLKNSGCRQSGNCSVNYIIQVPASVAVVVTTNAGSITVSGITDDVDLTTEAGSIKAFDLGSDRVRARSKAGSIDVSVLSVPDDIDVETGAGSVRVTVPDGTPYAVDANSSAGGTQVRVDEDAASPHKIRAVSTAGQVSVRND